LERHNRRGFKKGRGSGDQPSYKKKTSSTFKKAKWNEGRNGGQKKNCTEQERGLAKRKKESTTRGRLDVGPARRGETDKLHRRISADALGSAGVGVSKKARELTLKKVRCMKGGDG